MKKFLFFIALLSIVMAACQNQKPLKPQPIILGQPREYAWAMSSDYNDEPTPLITVVTPTDSTVTLVTPTETTTYKGRWRQTTWTFDIKEGGNIIMTQHSTTLVLGNWWIRYADHPSKE